MAPKKSMLCLILVAFMILCPIEGRIRHLNNFDSSISISTTNVAVADVSPPPPPSAGRDVDNFRPTAPGHSPGVGHSLHN
ncbi:hypothetical protein Fmac_002406 [Flemingia macrophylla]|uniref:Encoded peptide n=1 Tax=Flemingia macrophylla TaxID=520843 RepID=A0ABD1NKG4_9FABA